MEKKLVLALAILSVFVLGLVLGAGNFCYPYKSAVLRTRQEQNLKSPANEVSEKPAAEARDAVSTSDSAWDKLWANYKSPQGISFRYPKQILGLNRCGDRQIFYVPTKVLEDKENGTIYIAPEYYYDYPALADGSQDTSQPCQKIMNTLEQIGGKGINATAHYSTGNILGGLDLHIRVIKDTNGLAGFAQDIFGTKCQLDTEVKAEMGEASLYEIKKDKLGMEGPCPMNFPYRILFAQPEKKAVIYSLGQDCTFSASANMDCYDDYIADSIAFDNDLTR
jgi:hypothetical protein